ncbi:hypothetical protein R3I94_020856 [Phoxinus phoxinus]
MARISEEFRLGRQTLPSNTHQRAPFPRISQLGSRTTERTPSKNSETESKMAAPCVTCLLFIYKECRGKVTKQLSGCVLLCFVCCAALPRRVPMTCAPGTINSSLRLYKPVPRAAQQIFNRTCSHLHPTETRSLSSITSQTNL